jgi:hypothetical protein
VRACLVVVVCVCVYVCVYMWCVHQFLGINNFVYNSFLPTSKLEGGSNIK